MAWFSLVAAARLTKEMEDSINQECQATISRHQPKKQFSAEVAELRETLREKEKLLQANEVARQELSMSHEVEVRDLKNQVIAKDERLLSQEAELRSLRFRLENLSEQMSQIGKDKDRMISELARLNAELKEKKLILAQHEREEWQSIGWRNGLKRRLGKLGSCFSGAGDADKQKNDKPVPLTSPD